ncbi:hypothetical protein HII17_13530 [Thalassotalea sp. M1531]|uniref:Succinylglutamate desuccinylase/Aspartoacylase catalytic domain-containing protein n=1 Tax=Thalassotalea algicola TaxID=2716224 RepID=A0A7Y0Q856_9GAMM|nr:succinylglutamate desuccinylase/aspartoacylase family protein [Thalassotalea algicola]NMP32582.1 hypothetical protein [Thalassotalea algicola]
MTINYTKLEYFKNLTAEDIPDTPVAWLHSLSASTVIDFVQSDDLPWRVITTLLHGNEPSGFYAIHKLIKESAFSELSVNVRIVLGSIEAAQYKPEFTQRYLTDGMDINRCFGSNSLSQYYLRAQMLASSIRQVEPEAIVDLHNTSGDSPAFGVSCHQSHQHLSLTGLFCQSMIISHIRLGALMEQDFGCPVVTIECGGATKDSSHHLTYKGIVRYLNCEDKSNEELAFQVEVIYHPMRVRVVGNTSLAFANEAASYASVTLRADIEEVNFINNINGMHIGWVDANGLSNLELEEPQLHGKISDYFAVQDGKLVGDADLRIFMATSRTDIALNDCLFYIAKHQAI